ncbi:MAG TPA: proton-conducting transporter membrane subunit [Vicinamibacterales bacterium]|nr:proton-conducting transporter membrane subunit [Vicinamibacterales bacterium]
MSLIALPLIPLAAVLLSRLPLGTRFAPAVTLLAAATAFALAVRTALRVVAARELVALAGWLSVDGLSALVWLLVTFVSLMAALYSWGYLAAHESDARRIRSYYAHFNLFVFALVLVPLMAEPAVTWIAVEFTAVFSVLLVAFDNTRGALEAAWKYIALMFMGAAIALLGFFVLFWAQAAAGGGHDSWDGLRAVAPGMPPVLVMAAFALILVGFGTKVGFAPMHTWLPDAHSQAPSPVCALLSGVKTTTVLYTLLRLVPLLPPARAAVWLQVVGLISVGVAAFLLLQVRDYKRLFAYSTVEHMGIIFVAAGLGAPGGFYTAMLQMVSHSLTKSFCFFAAGAALLAVGTREIASVRGLIRTSPVAGAALLFGALAIGGAPPFAVFLSEFSVFRAGVEQHDYLVTALLVVFITVAFFGILLHVNRMVFGRPTAPVPPAHAGTPLPPTCVLTLVLAAIPVLVFGLYQPAWLHGLLMLAASRIAPVARP